MNTENLKIAHIHVWDQKNKGDHAIVLAVQELLRANFLNCQIQDFPVEVLKKKNTNTIKELNQADFVIIGGGGIFYSYFLPFDIEVIQAIEKPIYIFGLGYIKEVDAPPWEEDKTKSVIALVNKAKRVGVRDYNTKKFLSTNGIPDQKIEVIGDPAIFLTEKSPQNFTFNENIKIGLNLNYSGWLGFGKWRDDILQAYKEVIDYFHKEYSAQVYYLKHHPGEENIYKELGVEDLIMVDLEPAEQKYVYGQLDLVIGMMLHVGVMTFGALTPEISVAYDIRNYGFAEFINKPELVVDLDKLKEGGLLERVKKVFAAREQYAAEFASIKENIRRKEVNFLQSILNDEA